MTSSSTSESTVSVSSPLQRGQTSRGIRVRRTGPWYAGNGNWSALNLRLWYPNVLTVNWVTIVLLAIIGLITWRAYVNGFVREIVSLAAVVLAIPIAGLFYDDLFPKVEPIIDNSVLAALVSFLAIAGAVMIGGQVAAHVLKRAVAMLNLGVADHLAGAAFGFVKAVIVCQVLLIALVVFPEPDLREDIDDSVIGRRMVDAAPVVLALLPGGFDEGVDRFLERLNGTITGWLAPGKDNDEAHPAGNGAMLGWAP